MKVKADIQITKAHGDNISVVCVLETPEQKLYKEAMTVMPIKAKKEAVYCEIATVISLMFKTIAKNIHLAEIYDK